MIKAIAKLYFSFNFQLWFRYPFSRTTVGEQNKYIERKEYPSNTNYLTTKYLTAILFLDSHETW